MKAVVILAALSLAGLVSAQTRNLRWDNPACAIGPCEVRAVTLQLTRTHSSAMAGNAIVAGVETNSPGALHRYAFVQYLKGCMFESNATGPVAMVTREFFGRSGEAFQHRDWEVDSAPDADPIYWSTLNPGWDELRGFEIPRNANYSVAPPVQGRGINWGGKVSNLRHNALYVFDAPTPSTLSNMNGTRMARNSSLNFRICLHRIADIPRAVSPRTIVPHPIACLDWSSNFVYDFARQGFVEADQPHAFCQSQGVRPIP